MDNLNRGQGRGTGHRIAAVRGGGADRLDLVLVPFADEHNRDGEPVARAVALGHLGRQAEASGAVDELLQLGSDFAEHGGETIRRIFRYDQPVEILLEGLRKAGLELMA